ncbi:hypothetical protein [Los Azufres archaeal virus 1]|nr:hypothetical protein [Los Azufres archaeal virus 1]
MEYLATPITGQNVTVEPGSTYTIELPAPHYTKQGINTFSFGGALVVWQGGLNVDFVGMLEPVSGETVELHFGARELVTSTQYFTYPDPVFPMFQQGGNFNIIKWTPVKNYTFRHLTMQVVNNNPDPITIAYYMIIYYYYKPSTPSTVNITEINVGGRHAMQPNS